MTSDPLVIPTLSEEACQLALHSHHMGVSLHRLAWVKIENTTVDRSLGDERACRHPVLSPEDAKALRDYYEQSADAFTTEGDSERARLCAEAEANVRDALRAAGVSI
jgi:hypothetical protein